MSKSAGNVFPAEFTKKSTRKSAEKAKSSSNGWTLLQRKLELSLG